MSNVIKLTWQRRLRHVITKRAAEWESLPEWWTDYPPARPGHRWTYQELVNFYNGWFVREVLGHEGGMNVIPIIAKANKEKEDGKDEGVRNTDEQG